MGRCRGPLTLYLCFDVRRPGDARLIVARSFDQAHTMVPPGWTVKVATRFQAYRLGKVGIELEYYYPQKVTA